VFLREPFAFLSRFLEPNNRAAIHALTLVEVTVRFFPFSAQKIDNNPVWSAGGLHA
jgi:hypothetical protein